MAGVRDIPSPTPSRLPATVLHLLGLCSFAYSFKVLSGLDNIHATAFGWHFQHITILGLLFSTITFIVLLIRDIIPNSLEGLLEFLTAITVPAEGFITLMYWSLLWYDERLLRDPKVPSIPLLIDCTFHLFPVLFTWSNFLINTANFVRSRKHIYWIVGFIVGYTIWVHICWGVNGYWAYPIFAMMDLKTRCIFISGCGIICLGIYELGAFLHAKINGTAQKLKSA